jgi:D-threo-aldose 1-dehydrogenase
MMFPAMTNGLRLGLGGAPLGNLFTAIGERQARDVLQAALADGCRSFDTAPHYGHGLSEHRFGQAFREHESPAQAPRPAVSSKAGRLLTPAWDAARNQMNFCNILPYNQHWDYSARGVRQSVMDSLQRMGLARLDTVFIHDCCQVCHGDEYPRVLRQVVREAIPELQRMKQEGWLGHVGIGVNVVQVCLDVLAEADLDCILLAGRYTLIDHSGLARLLPLCQQRGVRVAIGGAFNSGILATGVKQNKHEPLFNYEQAPAAWVKKVAAVEAVCEACQVPLRAAALQFPLAHPCVDIVLAGAQTLAHWQDAVAMVSHPIPAGFWQALRAQGLLPEDAPTPA